MRNFIRILTIVAVAAACSLVAVASPGAPAMASAPLSAAPNERSARLPAPVRLVRSDGVPLTISIGVRGDWTYSHDFSRDRGTLTRAQILELRSMLNRLSSVHSSPPPKEPCWW